MKKRLKTFMKKTLVFFNTKITKSDYISKMKNRTKKLFVQKISVRSIPMISANLAKIQFFIFEEY